MTGDQMKMHEGRTPFSMADPEKQRTLAFAATFIVGTIAIVLARMAGFPPHWVWIIPVFLMGSYAALLHRHDQLLDERSGDNIYYLGLLFTLTSLSFALWQYEKQPDRVGEIISNFAVALATTIVGMVGRVLIQQQRIEPAELEAEAHHDLVASVGMFRATLSRATEEFDGFLRQLATAMTANQETSAKALAQQTADMAAGFRSATEVVQRTVADAQENILRHVHDLSVATSEISPQVKRLSLSIGNLEKKIDAVSVPPDLIQEAVHNRLRAVTAGIDELAEALHRSSALQVGLAEQVRQASQVTAVLSGASAKVPELSKEIERLTSSMGGAQRALEAVVDNFQSSATTLQGVQEHSRDQLRQLESHRRELDAQLLKTREGVSRTVQTLAGLADEITSKLSVPRR